MENENEQMKFNFQTQDQSDMNELLGLMKQLDNLKVNLEEIIKKHENAEKQAESDLAVEKAYEMFVKKEEPSNKLEECFDQECPVDEKVFDKEQTVDDFSILNIIPPQAKKWVTRLTIDEMVRAINDSDEEGYTTEDEFVGDLVDRLKDMAIAKYTNDILEGRVTEIEDEEIRSEVVDYMRRKKLEIPETIDPRDSIDLNKAIERLDKGCELELDEDLIDAIVEKLWKERDNISIKIRNNKISLGK